MPTVTLCTGVFVCALMRADVCSLYNLYLLNASAAAVRSGRTMCPRTTGSPILLNPLIKILLKQFLLVALRHRSSYSHH